MASREDEKKKNESILANKFSDYETYDDYRKDNNKSSSGYQQPVMSKTQWEQNKAKQPKVEVEATPSAIANTFADRIKAGKASDEDMKIAYDSYQKGEYTPGPKTLDYFNKNFTNNDVLDSVDEVTSTNKEAKNVIDEVTNEDGSVNEKAAKSQIDRYMQMGVEKGWIKVDKDGNYHFTKDKKGWETWATVASALISVVGLSMGYPVPAINFRAITGKDAEIAQKMAFEEGLKNIYGEGLKTSNQMEADIEAGEKTFGNEDALAAQEKHTMATAAQRDVIDAQTEAEMKKVQKQLETNTVLLKLEQEHAKDMAALTSKLSTASAKELTQYSKAGWVQDYIKECQKNGLSNKEIAMAIAGLSGTTPTAYALQNAEKVVGMATDTANAVSSFIPGK